MKRTSTITRIGMYTVGFFTLMNTTAVAYAASLQSPLNPMVSSIPLFISTLLKAMVIVALPVISVFIVLSGFRFLLAQGKEEGLKIAKENFKYVMYGTILILGAWTIASIIVSVVAQVTN